MQAKTNYGVFCILGDIMEAEITSANHYEASTGACSTGGKDLH